MRCDGLRSVACPLLARHRRNQCGFSPMCLYLGCSCQSSCRNIATLLPFNVCVKGSRRALFRPTSPKVLALHRAGGCPGSSVWRVPAFPMGKAVRQTSACLPVLQAFWLFRGCCPCAGQHPQPHHHLRKTNRHRTSDDFGKGPRSRLVCSSSRPTFSDSSWMPAG